MPPVTTSSAELEVKVKPKVAVGISTAATGTVSLVSFLLAIYAYTQGARDEATIGAIATGIAALLAMVAGRVAQAVAGINAAAPAAATLDAVASDVLPIGREELEAELYGVYQRIRRLEHNGADDVEPRDEHSVYMTGDEPTEELAAVGPDPGVIPADLARETEGEPLLDGDVEVDPSLEELGVRTLADVRVVESHQGMRDRDA